MSENAFGGGLEHLTSSRSPQTPSFPPEKGVKGDQRARGGRPWLGEDPTDDLFEPRNDVLFDAEFALERKGSEAISGRDSRSVFRNDGVYPNEHTTQNNPSMPFSRLHAVGASEVSYSVRVGGEGIQNVTQRDSKRPKERTRDQIYKKRFSMGSSVPSYGSPRDIPGVAGGPSWPREIGYSPPPQQPVMVFGYGAGLVDAGLRACSLTPTRGHHAPIHTASLGGVQVSIIPRIALCTH